MAAAVNRLEIGAILAERYEIVEIVGRGGMGTVYRANDLRLDAPVAVKEMRERPGSDDERAAAVAQFEREARMLARLRHPNLPVVTDYFVDSCRWYLVMEFVEGVTVEALLRERRGSAPLDDVLAWGIAIADLLDYLHTQEPPIVFRDVKPANVIVRPDGMVKLIDFGIARRYHEGASSDTLLYGSPGYSPPEQYGRSQTDPRSDIFALGATLHHLATGRDPAPAPFRFPRARSLNPDTPPELDDLLSRCLSMAPDDRPSTASEVRDELVRLRVARSERGEQDGAAASRDTADPAPAGSRGVTTPERRPVRDARRLLAGRRARASLAVVTCIAAVAAAGLLIRSRHAAGQDPPAAVRPVAPSAPALDTPSPPVREPAGTEAAPVLSVVSDAPGAAVFVDDRQVGVTPWESAEVAVGVHTLRIVPRPGAGSTVPWRRQVELRMGEVLGVGPLSVTPGTTASGDGVPVMEMLGDPLHVRAPDEAREPFQVLARFRVTHASGTTGRVAAFFYERDQMTPLKPRDPASAYANKEGQLSIAAGFRVDGDPVEVPVTLTVPLTEIPATPGGAWWRVVVFIGDKPVFRTGLYPYTNPAP